jgi:hypothetical protein
MWNPFKKIKSNVSSGMMGMMQKIAMKKLEKMSPEERNKIMRDAFKPENKEKMFAAMEQMKASGHISEEQYEAARQKLGF